MEIKITQTGKHKIEVIKLIRLFSGLSLIESKIIAENRPSVFKLGKVEFDFEQIKKNFEAIGAKVEKVEDPKKNIPAKPSEDTKGKTSKPKARSKAYRLKKDKKVWSKAKTLKVRDKNWPKLKQGLNPKNGIDDILFAQKVQKALYVAIAASAISGGMIFYCAIPDFVLFSMVAIVTAIPLKGLSPENPKTAGVLAAAFVLFVYVINPIFYTLLYVATMGETWIFGMLNLFIRYFHAVYPSVAVPLGIAFFVAYMLNRNVNDDGKSKESNNKAHKTRNKSLRRKNRKLD